MNRTRPRLGEILLKLMTWLDRVRAGADPIEAMGGHVCDPECWHRQPFRQDCPRCPHDTYEHGEFGCTIQGCPCRMVPAGKRGKPRHMAR